MGRDWGRPGSEIILRVILIHALHPFYNNSFQVYIKTFAIFYLLILIPFFILQAITKWPLSLAYLVSFLLAYVGYTMLFKGDQDFFTFFMKIHHGQEFWTSILPFLVINGCSILLLKIKEDSKKMKGKIEQ